MNTAIITGGGKGRRFGGGERKQFVELNAKPVIYHSIYPFQSSPFIDEIIVVLPEDRITAFRKRVVNEFRFDKVVEIVPGGKERQDSVFNALRKVSAKTDLVAVHDAVRPFIDEALINRLVESIGGDDGVIPSIRILQTVKEVDGNSYVKKTLDRDFIVEIQTPQVFKYQVLKKAYDYIMENNIKVTDDSSAVELTQGKVRTIEGSRANRKITHKEDLGWM
ncbi:MAG: 2-C-methyl-D-erythritol 4-phosphate cytidylyltransferase [bacterium]|nr:2-C-methyl-D-erythritol 4-phosphate cytidylyltransferase [bacterium]